jgi:hypothetical protein
LCLQGRGKIPTGGIVRERKQIRCNSETDSKVWMEEGFLLFLTSPYALEVMFIYFRGGYS